MEAGTDGATTTARDAVRRGRLWLWLPVPVALALLAMGRLTSVSLVPDARWLLLVVVVAAATGRGYDARRPSPHHPLPASLRGAAAAFWCVPGLIVASQLLAAGVWLWHRATGGPAAVSGGVLDVVWTLVIGTVWVWLHSWFLLGPAGMAAGLAAAHDARRGPHPTDGGEPAPADGGEPAPADG